VNESSATTEIDFGLDDMMPDASAEPAAVTTRPAAGDPDHNLEDWATQQLSKPIATSATVGVAFDIETGPQDDEALRALYTEPTFEEFAESCDKRWKPETVTAKYEESKGKGFEAFRDKAALSPLTGRIVAIGMLVLPAVDPFIAGSNVVCDATEKPILVDFWKQVQDWLDKKLTIVGHNIFSFDLPFLTMRSRFHSVDIPVDVVRFGGRYPSWNSRFVDTMQVVAFGDNHRFTKLDALAKFFGVGAKTEGVSGKDFAKLWTEDHARACEYLTNDVKITAAVAKKLMVF